MSADAVHPVALTCGGIEATCDTRIGDHQEIFPNADRRRDVGAPFRRSPGDVGVRNVAFSGRAYSQNVVIRESGSDKQHAVLLVEDDGCHKLLGGAVDYPMPLAVARVIARQALAA